MFLLHKKRSARMRPDASYQEVFYRLGIKDGLRLKSTVKSVLEMMS